MCCDDMIMSLNDLNWDHLKEHVRELYKNTTESIDPSIREWPLMSDPLPTISISTGYLVLITLLTFIMKRIDEFHLKFVIFCYNIFSFFLNIYISAEIILLKYEANDYKLCTNIHAGNPVYSDRMNRVIWWFYVSKGVELLDTVFFLLRKKFYKLSFLHIYNHATMFPVWWYLLATGKWLPSGTTAVPALINSMLHILMYYYYALSSIGPYYQKYIWWKKYLTFFQMIQFAFLIVYCSLLLYEQCDPQVNDRMLWLVIYYSLSHVVLIYDFYTNSYYKVMYNRIENKNDNSFGFSSSPKRNDEFNITVTKRRPLRNNS